MPGNEPKFTFQRRTPSVRSDDDFKAVFAGDLADRPSMPMDIPVDLIDVSPYQARGTFAGLDELAEAIRVHGFTSRIRVRPHPQQPNRYQLVYGERRLRAAKMVGLRTVPSDVAQHSDVELREIGLTENLQRQDLDPLEEALALRQAIDEGDYTIRSLAERIGKDKGYVQNRLKLLETPPDVQQMVETRPDTVRAAREIAKLPGEDAREPIIASLLAGKINAQTVSQIVRDVTAASSEQADVPVAQRVVAALQTRTSRAAAGTHTAGVTPDDRQLTRDLDTLQDVMSRLHAQVADLTAQQRSLLARRLDQHLTALEALLEVLR